jgi:hypothetical protein
MAQSWLYYLPIIIQREGRIGLTARMVELDGALNTPEAVVALIDQLTAELAPDEPQEGELPVLPLSWTLITARQGPSVQPRDNGDTT